MIRTSCKDCVFALKSKIGVQYGCSLNKLETFEKRGAEVERIDNHLEIVNRICMFCRDEKWAKKNSILDEAVKKETNIKHSYIIIYNQGDCLNLLFETIEDLDNQTLTPSEVYVINNSHDYKISNKIFNHTKKIFENKCGYYVQTVYNKFTNDELYDNDYLMSLYLGKVHGNWMTLLLPGQKVRKDFTLNLNNLINVDLEKICALLPKEGLSGSTYQVFVTKSFGGNYIILDEEDKPLLNLNEKLLYSERKYKTNMVRSLEEVCPIN